MKRKMKTKETKSKEIGIVRVPPELKELKGMKAKELLERYYFPNKPFKSWYLKGAIGMALDRDFVIDDPPPYELNPIPDVETCRDIEVLEKLSGCFKATDFLENRRHLNHFKAGESVDLKSILLIRPDDYLIRRSGSGRGQVKLNAKEALEDKYVMVCCCHAPALSSSSLWEAVLGCSEMYSKLGANNKFEMVLVIKTRPGWTHPLAREKQVFRQTFSAFPLPCLAVPFDDHFRRPVICFSLGLLDLPKILLVGPDGKVLLSTELGRLLNKYPFVPLDPNKPPEDTTPFPFLNIRWKLSPPSSLKGLLFHSSESVFRKKKKISRNSGCDVVSFIKEEVFLSDLNYSKPVALYLFLGGNTLPLLRHVAQGCSRANKDLEVVVVYVPTDNISPSFPELFSTELAKREIPWWVVPYNFSASVLLEHMFEMDITWERVIIIGPNDQYVDLHGLRFMQIYGVDAYPFTLQSVAQKTVEELSQVTLDSFLEALQLQASPGQKALFYFDFPYCVNLSVFEQATRLLHHKEVQLYFTSFSAYGKHEILDPKHVKPTDAVTWNTLGADKFEKFFLRFFNNAFPTIVAFGEDGRICSLLAHDLPLPSDDGGLEIKGNLLEEVSSILEKYLTHYDLMDYQNDEVYDHQNARLQELRRQRQLW